jgi:hypothetical protein
MHPATTAASGDAMGTGGHDPIRRRFQDIDHSTSSEILLLRLESDLDEFAGQCTADEHDAPILIAAHRITAGDEAICSDHGVHPRSVRVSRGAESPGPRAARQNGLMESEQVEWYWDLVRGVAVKAEDRGPGDQTLGPYSSRVEAEHWKDKVEQRNEEWAGADEAWEQQGEHKGEESDR